MTVHRQLRAAAAAAAIVTLAGCTQKGTAVGVQVARLVALLVAGVSSELSKSSHGGSGETARAAEEPGPLDLEYARGILVAAGERARRCRGGANGPRGRGLALLSVDPSGTIRHVTLDRRFHGTRVGACVVDEMLASAIRSYSGEPAVLRAEFVVE